MKDDMKYLRVPKGVKWQSGFNVGLSGPPPKAPWGQPTLYLPVEVDSFFRFCSVAPTSSTWFAIVDQARERSAAECGFPNTTRTARLQSRFNLN